MLRGLSSPFPSTPPGPAAPAPPRQGAEGGTTSAEHRRANKGPPARNSPSSRERTFSRSVSPQCVAQPRQGRMYSHPFVAAGRSEDSGDQIHPGQALLSRQRRPPNPPHAEVWGGGGLKTGTRRERGLRKAKAARGKRRRSRRSDGANANCQTHAPHCRNRKSQTPARGGTRRRRGAPPIDRNATPYRHRTPQEDCAARR